jgi:large conductance mechanosensitive channel
MKKFFAEFKKFIMRGNVVDMAVGVTVGSAFTAIVNGLTNFILKPIINWVLAMIFGANSLTDLYTFLKVSYKDVLDEAGAVIGQEVDLANSIYIDWGSFINAILNFFIIAFVLFCIVKLVNKMREEAKEAKAERISKEDRWELKKRGIKLRDEAAVKAYMDEKAAIAAAKKAEEDAKAAEAARIAQENSTEGLLKQIIELIKKDN